MDKFKERFAQIWPVAILFVSTLFIFGPIYIYYMNIKEFSFVIFDVWYVIAVIALLGIVLIVSLFSVLKPGIWEKALLFLCAVSILLWFQGNILVWNYGLFDGKEIPWNNYRFNGYIDTALWIVFIVLVFWKNKWFMKISKKVCIGLLLVQLVSLACTIIQAPDEPSAKCNSVNEEQKFAFSAEKNVIILVLDAFQSDIFQEILNQDPAYRNMFDGFTYFRNAVGGFPTTYPSIPLILTGQYYDNSVPIQQYIKKAYSESIPEVLGNNGYQADLFTDVIGTIHHESSNGLAYSVWRLSPPETKNEVVKLYEVTFFRYMPHFLKRSIYNQMQDLSNQKNSYYQADLDFARQVNYRSKVDVKGPVFRFYHLRGVHPPYELNEKLEQVTLGFSREDCKRQAQAALHITDIFLTSLKKLGIYDQSLIFVVADHGSGAFDPQLGVIGDGDSDKNPGLISHKLISSGIPLVLVKPFESKGPIKVSDAPVSLSDIPGTVGAEISIRDQLPGPSMFEINEKEPRVRTFLAYKWEHKYWAKDYLPPIKEYKINGFSWLNQSWYPTYRVLAQEGIRTEKPKVLSLGSSLRFGLGGDAETYQGTGWSNPENGFTWTDGKLAVLSLPVDPVKFDIVLNIEMFPLIGGGVERQRVNVYVNGQQLQQLNVIRGGDYQVIIPREFLDGSLLNIYFELPDAVSPAELKINEDSRRLGVGMRSINIIKESDG